MQYLEESAQFAKYITIYICLYFQTMLRNQTIFLFIYYVGMKAIFILLFFII